MVAAMIAVANDRTGNGELLGQRSGQCVSENSRTHANEFLIGKLTSRGESIADVRVSGTRVRPSRAFARSSQDRTLRCVNEVTTWKGRVYLVERVRCRAERIVEFRSIGIRQS